MPKLNLFPEIHMAFIGFSNLHPVRLRKVVENYKDKEQVRGLIQNEKELLLLLMDENESQLTELIFEIMGILQAQPSLRIITTSIVKLEMNIPDKVLNQVYKDLPDRRRK